jgi:hypothetical protein
MRALDVAHQLVSQAAEQLSELVQRQQRGVSHQGLPSAVLDKVAELKRLVGSMQLGVSTASAAPASALAALVSAGAGCHSGGNSSSKGGSSPLVMAQQTELPLQALLQQLALTDIQQQASLPMVVQVGALL